MNRSHRVMFTGALALTAMGLLSSSAEASGLKVDTGRVVRNADGSALTVSATVTWRNAWRTERNHDAVWLFVKLRTPGRRDWRHANITTISAAAATPAAACHPSADRVGGFCAPAVRHRGDVSWNVTFQIERGRMSDAEMASVEAQVHGIEMVIVPEGPFSIGDPDPKSVEYAAFYRSNAAGEHAGTLRINSEAEIRVAPEQGALYYRVRTPQYEGDRQGPVPAAFPKGTRAFYIMKYEILQGQYAAMLDAISPDYTFFRSPFGGPGYYAQRGTIRLDGDRFVADAPARPANWTSWDDGAAFVDWAGLRPMTELEFTKAARGPAEPVPGDYPWGTASKDRLLRRNGPDDELVQSDDADEARLTDESRDILGASYYWVMDLAGSVWEKMVTIGHPAGRAFLGTHGDGALGSYGMATNADWPSGDHNGGGYGYRGGGYYERGMVEREFNPFSPTAWRRFGSWGGAPRAVAYGFRGGRTADVSAQEGRRD
jgi:formylglycine-generating enzyme required for sulfatase activity